MKTCSREVIWQHAKTYHWMKTPNWCGDPWTDLFIRGEAAIVVRYSTNGRVVRMSTAKAIGRRMIRGQTTLANATRDTVLDELERWARDDR